jgi:hypothetical protein
MIENAQKTENVIAESSARAPKRALPRLHTRRLSAIEIAEGALLADIGVVFQLLIKYLPVGGDMLRLLVPVIFAVIVLRRGLYVGCMSLCVALFISYLVLGPGGVPLFLLEAGAGLFLGVTMRQRLSHLLTLVLGVLCGALAAWAALLSLSLLTGGTFALILVMHRSYASLASLVGLGFRLVRLGGLWQHTLFPLLDRFMQWGFQHWLLLLYLGACVVCLPLVTIVYFITNFFLRVLGYPVRPFPGYRLEGALYWLARWLFRLVPGRAFARFPLLHDLKRELRRLNIARLRQQRLEREARKSA